MDKEGIAKPDPVIAGGNVAAHVGSFAAALGEKMAGLASGRPEFAGQNSGASPRKYC